MTVAVQSLKVSSSEPVTCRVVQLPADDYFSCKPFCAHTRKYFWGKTWNSTLPISLCITGNMSRHENSCHQSTALIPPCLAQACVGSWATITTGSTCGYHCSLFTCRETDALGRAASFCALCLDLNESVRLICESPQLQRENFTYPEIHPFWAKYLNTFLFLVAVNKLREPALCFIRL